jgi:GntR family transcriptional regulator, transcriptional repressor for pyruvate dehydrogenase complex
MKPIDENPKNRSLKAACATQVEALILSGELKISEKLPPERELAARLGVSRPVLHEALVELAMKSLVTISPRHGVTVNDFRNQGSLALIDSLLVYQDDKLSGSIWKNMFDFRMLIEGETAFLAASHRSNEQLKNLKSILEQEQAVDCSNTEKLTELDFAFHLMVASLSGNMIYSLLLNTFKTAYTSYTHAFFQNNLGSPIVNQVFQFHVRLADSITNREATGSKEIMVAMLVHGEQNWKGV